LDFRPEGSVRHRRRHVWPEGKLHFSPLLAELPQERVLGLWGGLEIVFDRCG
jgi:hypothetical protein